MGKKLDLAGQRFGCLTALAPAGHRLFGGQRKTTWLCRCDCGREIVTCTQELRRGDSRSCGCRTYAMIADRRRRHGMASSAEYRIWRNMRTRCAYRPHISWPRYGGRGIVVCERWQDFAAFYVDMGPRPSPKHSLDRFPDNDGPYAPGNVRWALPWQQARNRQKSVKMPPRRAVAGLLSCLG